VILERILDAKRDEVAAAKRRCSEDQLRRRPLASERRRGFRHALLARSGTAVIAEIKKASPSRGIIRADFNPALHARQYEVAGATCVSVLTDEAFFQGALADLATARAACSLPLLRKDFVVDPYQIVEARAWGADAVLLIVAALDEGSLRSLSAVASEEGLDVLVEVHDEAEMRLAIAVGARLIGINNRDLHTFVTTLDVTRRLAPLAPAGTLIVAESGIRSASDIASLRACGVGAFLVGEHLMAAPDPGTALESLLRP
jgi:indole-3-glycerol phosphate synthase